MNCTCPPDIRQAVCPLPATGECHPKPAASPDVEHGELVEGCLSSILNQLERAGVSFTFVDDGVRAVVDRLLKAESDRAEEKPQAWLIFADGETQPLRDKLLFNEREADFVAARLSSWGRCVCRAVPVYARPLPTDGAYLSAPSTIQQNNAAAELSRLQAAPKPDEEKLSDTEIVSDLKEAFEAGKSTGTSFERARCAYLAEKHGNMDLYRRIWEPEA